LLLNCYIDYQDLLTEFKSRTGDGRILLENVFLGGGRSGWFGVGVVGEELLDAPQSLSAAKGNEELPVFVSSSVSNLELTPKECNLHG